MDFTWSSRLLFQVIIYLPLIGTLIYFCLFNLRRLGSAEAKDDLATIGIYLTNALILAAVGSIALSVDVVNWAYRISPFHIAFSYWQIPLYLLAMDLWFYCGHRIAHSVPFLWAGHSSHHSVKRMSPPAVNRGSFIEILIQLPLRAPLVLLGFNPIALVLIWKVLIFAQTFYLHSERTWPRWLNAILITPQVHRIHHSKDPLHRGRNYGGVFSFWDRAFGTYCEVAGPNPLHYGIKELAVETQNPLRILLAVPAQILRDVRKHRSLRPLFIFGSKSLPPNLSEPQNKSRAS